jgi:hypothetical protein
VYQRHWGKPLNLFIQWAVRRSNTCNFQAETVRANVKFIMTLLSPLPRTGNVPGKGRFCQLEPQRKMIHEVWPQKMQNGHLSISVCFWCYNRKPRSFKWSEIYLPYDLEAGKSKIKRLHLVRALSKVIPWRKGKWASATEQSVRSWTRFIVIFHDTNLLPHHGLNPFMTVEPHYFLKAPIC